VKCRQHALVWPAVVRRHHEGRVGAELGGAPRGADSCRCVVGARAGDHGRPACPGSASKSGTSGLLHGRGDDPLAFLRRQRRRLAGGAARHKAVDTSVDLPSEQVAEGRLIKVAVLVEWRHEGGECATDARSRARV
jgi:hypothetical protein